MIDSSESISKSFDEVLDSPVDPHRCQNIARVFFLEKKITQSLSRLRVKRLLSQKRNPVYLPNIKTLKKHLKSLRIPEALTAEELELVEKDFRVIYEYLKSIQKSTAMKLKIFFLSMINFEPFRVIKNSLIFLAILLGLIVPFLQTGVGMEVIEIIKDISDYIWGVVFYIIIGVVVFLGIVAGSMVFMDSLQKLKK